MTGELWPMGASAICAAFLMPIVISVHPAAGENAAGSPQNIHEKPTSRLGGLIVFVAYIAAIAVAFKLEHLSLRSALPLLVSVLPVLLVGLREDITHRMRPRHRLTAIIVSAMLASASMQGIVPRVDLPFVDDWLAYLPFVLPLTWFMVAGACNAMNIIDGAHGLAGGIALLMFSGIAVMANSTGDMLVFSQAISMAGAIAGFLLWNYPRGKVFLGDSGSYFIGFMYAQLAIQLVARNNAISAWFVMVLAAYPVVETLFSIYRRRLLQRRGPMQPDALHLHSLIYRGLTARAKPNGLVKFSYRHNARVAPRIWLHGVLCFAAALLLANNTPALIGFMLFYALHYVTCYQAAVLQLSVAQAARVQGSVLLTSRQGSRPEADANAHGPFVGM